MIDINYLGHYFTKDCNYREIIYPYNAIEDMFKCQKCDLVISAPEYTNCQKYYYDAKNINKYGCGWIELNITCVESIIKGIIE